MKYHKWNSKKNEQLKAERDISFEEIVFCIQDKKILKIVDHHNQKKYPGQKIYIIDCKDYIYLVPFVESEKEIFLKTIIPSRKAKKIYK